MFIIKSDGTSYEQPYKPAGKRESCTFERIYFSRGNDPQIYSERKALGGCSARSSMKASAGTSKQRVQLHSQYGGGSLLRNAARPAHDPPRAGEEGARKGGGKRPRVHRRISGLAGSRQLAAGGKNRPQGYQTAHVHFAGEGQDVAGIARLRHYLRGGHREGRPRMSRRLDSARDDPPTADFADTQPHKSRGRS